jgi:hypothetical protein
MRLVVDDPLAHRALDGLLRAEAAVRRRLSADLEREGLSAAASPCWSCSSPPAASWSCARCAAGCTPPRPTPRRSSTRSSAAGSSAATGSPHDRRAASSRSRARRGARRPAVPRARLARRAAFAALDDDEKRTLAELCRKLAA